MSILSILNRQSKSVMVKELTKRCQLTLRSERLLVVALELAATLSLLVAYRVRHHLVFVLSVHFQR
jgi:hypothetical protein